MEPDYLFLTRDRDTSGQKYQEIRSRLLEAKVSEGLEVQRKGERFSLIDPPSLPEKPDKPNRSAIVLLGFILALAAESAPAPPRNRSTIRYARRNSLRLTQPSPLAVIPSCRTTDSPAP
jgi:hypothetical protein